MTDQPLIHWTEADQPQSAQWRSGSALPPPKRVVLADDNLTADSAYRLACEGTGLLWRGDFQNARQLLEALARRVDKPPRRTARERKAAPQPAPAPAERFHLYRQARSQRARILGMVLIAFDADYGIGLRRAPDVRQACTEAFGPAGGASVFSLREMLGVVGAHEWRKNGLMVPALGERIHAHYGVFAPTRHEYVELVALAQMRTPPPALAFDIGTGTGVLAAVLAQRGVERIVATDQDPRALTCARENIERLGLGERIEVVDANLFPVGRALLVVCNPPWVPARPTSPLEQAVYDPESRMLRGFVAGLRAHLEPGGEGWLILSDLAEHLGLRTRAELLALFEQGGLKVVGRSQTRPTHPRSSDANDPLHAARAAEVTSLWRLAAS